MTEIKRQLTHLDIADPDLVPGEIFEDTLDRVQRRYRFCYGKELSEAQITALKQIWSLQLSLGGVDPIRLEGKKDTFKRTKFTIVSVPVSSRVSAVSREVARVVRDIFKGVKDAEFLKEQAQEFGLEVYQQYLNSSEKNVKLGAGSPRIVPGDPELTSPGRGVAGIGGTSPFIFEEEANPRGLGYVQSKREE